MTLESNLISLYFCILSAQKHFLGCHLQDSVVAGDGGWMSVLSWTDGLRFLSKRETTYEFDDFFFYFRLCEASQQDMCHMSYSK